jgi:hypothetical protein
LLSNLLESTCIGVVGAAATTVGSRIVIMGGSDPTGGNNLAHNGVFTSDNEGITWRRAPVTSVWSGK